MEEDNKPNDAANPYGFTWTKDPAQLLMPDSVSNSPTCQLASQMFDELELAARMAQRQTHQIKL